MRTFRLPKLKCNKCKHIWIPRLEIRPAVCPKCKDPRWDRCHRKNVS